MNESFPPEVLLDSGRAGVVSLRTSRRDPFGEAAASKQPESSKCPAGHVRVKRVPRHRVELRPSRLEDQLPEEHGARVLRDAASELDLAGFCDRAPAARGAGRHEGARARRGGAFPTQAEPEGVLVPSARAGVPANGRLGSEGAGATKRIGNERPRAAEDPRNRVEKTLRHVEEQSPIKSGVEDTEKARASTTDPERRVTKTAYSGFRTACNL